MNLTNCNKMHAKRLRELQDSFEGGDSSRIKKCRMDWELAVSDELRSLRKKQDALKLDIDEIKVNLVADAPQMRELTDNDDESDSEEIDALNRIVRCLQKNISALTERVIRLETENKELKLKVNSLESNTINVRDLNVCIEPMQSAISEIDVSLENCNERIEKIESNLRSTVVQKDIPPRVRLNLPKFRGADGESPMKYLSELRAYVDLVKPKLPELICIIAQTVAENARDWWYLIEREVKSFDDYVARFKDRYWSKRIQRSYKIKMEYGRYYANSKLTRVDYATNALGIIKDLEMHESEEESVICLTGHFEKSVRHAILALPNKTFDEMLKILADYDLDDRKETNRRNQYHGAGGHSRKNERLSSHEDAQRSQQTNAVAWVVNEEDESSNEMEIDAEEDLDCDENESLDVEEDEASFIEEDTFFNPEN